MIFKLYDCPALALPKAKGSILLLAEFVLELELPDPNVKAPVEVEVPLPEAPRAGGKAAPVTLPKLWVELSPDA